MGRRKPCPPLLQFQRVEHLETDVSDVVFVFTVHRHALQDSSDGVVDLFAILKIRSAAVQNTWNTETETSKPERDLDPDLVQTRTTLNRLI